MKRVLYGVSPIGLGHATRASAVAGELEKAGVDVVLASGGLAVELLRGLGFTAEDTVTVPVPTVVGGEMKRTSFWYLRYWWGYRKTRKNMEKVVERLKPDLVVGDEEFAGVSVAMEKGMNHALVTDEFELGFARSAPARAIESRVSKWYGELLARASVVLVPDFGEDRDNVRYTGPIVRKVNKTKEEAIKEFSLPTMGRMVLLSMSGSGIGGHLVGSTVKAVKESGIAEAFLVISGNRGRRVEESGVYDLGVVSDNQNLVAAADLVVSTAGKSTIDEAASAGTPIIALPIKHHAEQERNARALGYFLGDEKRLRSLVVEKVRTRNAPGDYRGAERASQLLLSMI